MRDELRKLSILYAEDCRVEASGQLSLIGIFTDAMGCPNFPLVLPKFCVFIELSIPLESPLKELRLEAKTDDGQVLIDQVIPSEILAHQIASVPPENFEGLDEKRIGLRTQFVMGPVTFEKPTILRTKAYTELGEIRGRALRISAPLKEIQFQVMRAAQ